MKKKISVTYFIDGIEGQYDFDCAQKGVELNMVAGDVLNIIRNRLKYGEDVSEKEEEVLSSIRSLLGEIVIEG